MKTLHLTILVLLTTQTYGQVACYFDWNDANLKGKPEYVKETTFFSFDFLLSNSLKSNSCISMAEINEYHFDTVGTQMQHYTKWINDTSSISYKDKIQKCFTYPDSIVVITSDKSGIFLNKSIRQLDTNGAVVSEYRKLDTIRVYRDNDNKIKGLYTRFVGVDTDFKNKISNTYNSNGDIETQIIVSEKYYLLGPDSVQKSKILSEFKYIYDLKGNWIIKTEFIDNNIVSITQREIAY